MRRTVLVAAFGLGFIAGCGGETTTVTEPAEQLSKAQYIAKADAICRRNDKEVDPLGDQAVAAFKAGNYEKAANVVEKMVFVSQPNLDELQALPIPRGGEAVKQWLARLQTNLILVGQVEEALRSEDVSRIRSLVRELLSIGDEADGIARGYGFRACGQLD
jgi:hypothetical protein